MTLLIGLTGSAGGGKDTACDFVKGEVSNVYSFALAHALKAGASALFGVPLMKFYENKQEVDPVWGITYRDMLQKLGTEFARNMITPDFWLKRADAVYDEILEDFPTIVFCTDIRFDNEAKWVLAKGGIIVSVDRHTKILSEEEQGHASEAGVSDKYITHTIRNNGTLRDLKINTLELFKSMLQG